MDDEGNVYEVEMRGEAKTKDKVRFKMSKEIKPLISKEKIMNLYLYLNVTTMFKYKEVTRNASTSHIKASSR